MSDEIDAASQPATPLGFSVGHWENEQRLELAITVEDPKTFTEPVSWNVYHRPANIQAILPYDCQPILAPDAESA